MSLTLHILLLLAGLLLVVKGADFLVDGASAVARRWGLSEFVIGLTIVGMGTSAPEMVVSFIGAIEGNADISVGNVVGSNIFNTLLILGVTAIILPIAVTKGNRLRDVPMHLVVTGLLVCVLGLDGTLSRWDGAILLALFVAYMWMSFKQNDKEEILCSAQNDKEAQNDRLGLSILLVLVGLGMLVGGGKLFVNHAVDIAHSIGVSDKFIAITILAGGTSLPELATCVAAAVKKKGQLALGNIIGSNLFNILLILGGSALICPLSLEGISKVDLGTLLISALALLAAVFIGRKREIGRVSGALFVLLFAAYMAYLIMTL